MNNKLLPSPAALRLLLFPDTVRIADDRLTIAGHALASLADSYGTPLYVYDRATLDNAVEAYRSSLRVHYPGPSQIVYAGKAFLCQAMARWTQQHDLWVDCSSEGEMAMAIGGGVPREHILVHGVNKSGADLQAALRRAGTLVVDHLAELQHIAALLESTPLSPLPDLWLRLLPGVAVSTHHAHTQTGQQTSKFGMTPEELLEAARLCRERRLPLRGIHFHQGSNFRDPAPLIPAIELGLDAAREIGFPEAWHFSPGGGWGVAYHEDELPHPSIEHYVREVARALVEGCRARRLALPCLHLEPGRSLVARAGVAVYRVGAVKRRMSKTWLLIDGGMADNPRYALYGARYSCLPASAPQRECREHVSIAGPYCESGDILIEDLPMPKVAEGECLAVSMSGAYQLSMSSNYNGARRPAVLWLEEGRAQLIQRRETLEDLLRRDLLAQEP